MLKKMLILCAILLSIGSAFGVKCYSGSNGIYALVDCGAASDKCLNVRTEDGSDFLKECLAGFISTRTNREGCSSVPFDGIHDYLHLPGGMAFAYCLCEGDGCNGLSLPSGTSKAQSRFTLALMLSLLAILFMRR